jgi:hypothetical protein
VSLLRMLGSNCWRVAAFMASTLYGEPLGHRSAWTSKLDNAA